MKLLALKVLTVTLGLLAGQLSSVAAEPARIVCLGDSVTKAVRPGVKPDQTFCALLQEQLADDGQPVQVVNSGVGGNTTRDGLGRFQPDVLDHQPRCVVIMFGLNDSWIDSGQTASRLTVAEYRSNLVAMLERLAAADIDVVLMTPNPALAPTYGAERNATLKPYVLAVRQLAAERQLPLVDVYQYFSELAMEREINSLFTDDMHPNPAGQGQLAALLLPVLKNQLQRKTASHE